MSAEARRALEADVYEIRETLRAALVGIPPLERDIDALATVMAAFDHVAELARSALAPDQPKFVQFGFDAPRGRMCALDEVGQLWEYRFLASGAELWCRLPMERRP